MHLINVKTMKLEEFADDRVAPSYAILSHRWEDEEVSFKDLKRGRANQKKGFRKIELCCKQASEARLQYAWVDTCCIDKRSSAELSEAINSMFRWYQNASVCYAYLSDVKTPVDASTKVSLVIAKSLWFTRGWTLQELIAPRELEFYDFDWICLGTRTYLQDAIARVTNIPIPILTGKDKPHEYPIAQRMSWAARRKTTRIEDTAYCLLGIFGVNMPLLYGEGERAFIRLQEEIIKRSDDESIFAWPGICSPGRCTPDRCSGVADLEIATALEDATGSLLAKSPLLFAGCGSTVRSVKGVTPYRAHDYAFTNVGLAVKLPLLPWALDTYLAFLNCYLYSSGKAQSQQKICAIRLRKIKKGRGTTHFARADTISGCISTGSLEALQTATWEDIVIRDFRDLSASSLARLHGNLLYGFHLSISAISDLSPRIHRFPSSESITSKVEMPAGRWGTVAVIEMQDSRSEDLRTLVKLGFDFDFNAAVQVQLRQKPLSCSPDEDVMSSNWITFRTRRQASLQSSTHSLELSPYAPQDHNGYSDDARAQATAEQGVWTFLIADASSEVIHRIPELNARIVISQDSSDWTVALQAMDSRIPAFRLPPADDVAN